MFCAVFVYTVLLACYRHCQTVCFALRLCTQSYLLAIGTVKHCVLRCVLCAQSYLLAIGTVKHCVLWCVCVHSLACYRHCQILCFVLCLCAQSYLLASNIVFCDVFVCTVYVCIDICQQ